MYDLTVAGAVGIDTNVYLHNLEIDFNREGNFTDNIDYLGQAGGYAVSIGAALGYKMGLIAAIGDDYHGIYIKQKLIERNIPTKGLFVDPMGTKRSINIINKQGIRKNFYDGKGSMEIKAPDHLSAHFLCSTKIFHVNIVNWTRYLLKDIKKSGSILSVDLQDLQTVADPYRLDYIQAADFIQFSATDIKELEPIVNKLLELNPDAKYLIGRGKDGCDYFDNNHWVKYSNLEFGNLVVDTNGAGDSLAIGFLTGHLLEDFSIDEAVLRGQVLARYICGVKGSTDTLLDMSSLELLQNNESIRNQMQISEIR